MIINLGCASVDNHIPWDDIFDYHPLRECNIYIISLVAFLLSRANPFVQMSFKDISSFSSGIMRNISVI